MNNLNIIKINKKYIQFISILFLFLSIFSINCSDGDSPETPLEPSYIWPNKTRDYWPTTDWQTAPMADHGINESKMNLAVNYGISLGIDALLVVKDGYIVYERYFIGDQNTSSELWSATKSFTSTLVGIAIDKGYINNVYQLMTDFIPEHDFRDIKIWDVLTQRTGLEWEDGGPGWLAWVQSPDWTVHALARRRLYSPGTNFIYSTANSHFLSHLIVSATGMATGDFANEYLFKPLGINFSRLPNPVVDFSDWVNSYMIPLGRTTWQQDVQGYEIGGIGLYLTAREMAKLGFLYINKGIWDGQIILSESYIEEAVQSGRILTSYGYQWWTGGHYYRYFYARGSGGQKIAIVPTLDMVMVVKCKPYASDRDRDSVSELLQQIIPMIIDTAR